MRPDLNEHDAFMAGPQMHAIRGMVQVQYQPAQFKPR